jgi:hypothetical protein
MDSNNPKKSEIQKDVTYLLCPDSSCKLFYEEGRTIPCEDKCPKEKDLVKIIKCVCGELVELPGDYSVLRSVDHSCANGEIAGNFRMTGSYVRIYKRPE